jgi:hypothetical protein
MLHPASSSFDMDVSQEEEASGSHPLFDSVRDLEACDHGWETFESENDRPTYVP